MKKFPEKFNHALPVNELVNTLIKIHFISLALTLKLGASENKYEKELKGVLVGSATI